MREPSHRDRLADMRAIRRFTLGIILLAVSLAMPVFCCAAPFLVSDPYPKSGPQPTEFEVSSSQPKFSVPVERVPGGTVRLRLDLSRFPDGEQVIEIRAVNTTKTPRQESKAVSVRFLKNGKEVTLLPQSKPEPVKGASQPEGHTGRAKREPTRSVPGLR